ncbi:hypothetical protein PPYR_14550 [Photinus pyralis]|uniref:Methyltransferase type 12 domain-containing protein n=3 Tax=Photinus pyralis TaxID=7054 RepID=A0A1Y1MSW9_PHOPY|nr:juvenile hormone acid O-methyltransferase-like [Photinus pyralis]KAB0792591.1 hypothetical protein PPYR_14550 [Photinus pyralis]
MFRPAKYCENRSLTDEDFRFAIDNYWKYMKLRQYCDVLEIGCGPGKSASECVLPLLPKTCQIYVGVDKSPQMVEYANANYSADPRLRFDLMDITTDQPPRHFLNAFDHIVSFNCFHFVTDHRKALENVYLMTKPGGNIFISFPAKNAIFDVYVAMAREEKWAPYLGRCRQMLTPTQFCEDPQADFSDTLKEVGFSSDLCLVTERTYTVSKAMLLGFIEAVCTFTIPENLLKEFCQDHYRRMKKQYSVWQNDQGEVYLSFPFIFLVAHAAKV